MLKAVEKCIEVLRDGGLILYPTDTVWGIGCDATNEEAVKKIYALKRSDDKKSMLCLTLYGNIPAGRRNQDPRRCLQMPVPIHRRRNRSSGKIL